MDSLTDSLVSVRSPAWATSSAQPRPGRWNSLAEPELLASPTKWRCARSHCPQPCHCPPCPVGPEPQSYFRPLRGRPGLGKSEVLAAGHNRFPQRHEGHSLGLAPSVWWPSAWLLVPATSGSHPMAASVREQSMHHRDGLPVDKRRLVALGVGKAQKSVYLKLGPFCSMDAEHVCLWVIAVPFTWAKAAFFALLVSSALPPGSPTARKTHRLPSRTSSPDQQPGFPGRVLGAAGPAAPWLFVYLLEQRETRLLGHFLMCWVALNKSLDHSVLLFSWLEIRERMAPLFVALTRRLRSVYG